MGGGTGNIRTSRSQSSCNGFKTLYSILTSGNGGAGSGRRVYAYYALQGGNVNTLTKMFNIPYGKYRAYSEFFIPTYH